MDAVRVSGSWRDTEQIFVRVGGSWREVDQVWVRVGGSWRESWAGSEEPHLYVAAYNTDRVYKLTLDGSLVWNRPQTIDHPNASKIRIDKKGNNYTATGYDGGVKRNREGNTEWTYGGLNIVGGVAVDRSFVYMGGTRVHKLDHNGNFIWESEEPAGGDHSNGMVVDGSGFLYSCTGRSSGSLYVRRYNSTTGANVFSLRLSSFFSETIGAKGDSVYFGAGTNVYKRNPADSNTWSFTGFSDRITAVTTDESYIYALDRSGNLKKIAESYSSTTIVWETSTPASGISGLAVDQDGGIYVGSSEGVRKYNSSGEHVWTYAEDARDLDVGPGRYPEFW